MNILLIAGGWSSEREVSLRGAQSVYASLAELGHSITEYDPIHSLEGLYEAAKGKDFAFICLHGSPGEDGLIQAMLEQADCPYQGAGPAASMLALNKAAAKVLFQDTGLATAPFQLINGHPGADWDPELSYPIFIKANTGGSSLHMEQVERPEDLPAALDRLFTVSTSYIAEPAIAGAEMTCAVLGKLVENRETAEALPPILIRPALSSIFDYASKYSPGGAEELCPAPVPAELNRRIQDMALAAHNALGCCGYSRADFIVPNIEDPSTQPVLLEVNTLPGVTPASLLPKAAAAVGLSFTQLVGRLIQLGLARHQREKAFRESCG